MSWTKYYDDILTGKKSDKTPSFKKKEKQRTLTDFTDDGDFSYEDQYQDWSFNPEKDEEEEGPRRQTNEDILEEEI